MFDVVEVLNIFVGFVLLLFDWVVLDVDGCGVEYLLVLYCLDMFWFDMDFSWVEDGGLCYWELWISMINGKES